MGTRHPHHHHHHHNTTYRLRSHSLLALTDDHLLSAAGTSGSTDSSSRPGQTSPVGARDTPAVCTSRSVAKEAMVSVRDKPSESPWVKSVKKSGYVRPHINVKEQQVHFLCLVTKVNMLYCFLEETSSTNCCCSFVLVLVELQLFP